MSDAEGRLAEFAPIPPAPVDASAIAVHGGEPALAGLADLPAWPRPIPDEEAALLRVYRSGRWGSTVGDVVARFEGSFARYQDAAHGVAVANGTLAIVAALRAGGVGLGDEVIVPPYTFVATASTALFVGAIPVFADVDPDTHLLSPDVAAAAITDRTRAIVPVHLAGRPADMDAFTELGRRHDLVIVEDCAQAIGARYHGRAVGSIGDMGTFSFQSSKNMTAGEGGLVTTNDQGLSDRLYSQANVGRVRDGAWYQHDYVGHNLRLTEFQAAILEEQLPRHADDQATRDRNAGRLRAALEQVSGVHLPPDDPAVTSHGHHLFMLRVPELGREGLRDAAVDALAAEGIPAATGYVPLHRNEPLVAEARHVAERLGQPFPEADCPNADLVSSDTIWLGQRFLLGTEEQTAAIARGIAKVVEAGTSLGSADGKKAS